MVYIVNLLIFLPVINVINDPTYFDAIIVSWTANEAQSKGLEINTGE